MAYRMLMVADEDRTPDDPIAADVIIISDCADFRYVRQALGQGAVDYWLKPMEEEELGACLRAWLLRRKPGKPGKGAVTAAELTGLSPADQAIRYIEMNRAYELSSAEAARKVHLNPSYFSKLFRQTTGMTFTHYVREMRIREAKRLLEETPLRIAQIADRLGFSDSAYFTHTFKKATGLTPSRFRKQLNKE